MDVGPVLTVSQVTNYIKNKFDRDLSLRQLCIGGEIGDCSFRPWRGGESYYFTLKDADSLMHCVMFLNAGTKLPFQPQTGLKVLAFGKISVYAKDGKYQLYCENLLQQGKGDLHLELEELKRRLQKEGLFNEARKRPLPKFPHRVAVITSAAGDAVRDVIKVTRDRYPLAKLLILDVHVQGERAAAEIAGAIRYVNRYKLADVIYIGRGGGKFEDLFCFNDEALARTVYASAIPVVSGVGHEANESVSDLVADVRAATPSNAAEKISPERGKLLHRLNALQETMNASVLLRLGQEKKRLELLASSYVLQNPQNYVAVRRKLLEDAREKLQKAAQAQIAAKQRQADQAIAKLDALSPLRVLSRGYSIAFDSEDRPIRDAGSLHPGDRIRVRLERGAVTATVDQTEVTT